MTERAEALASTDKAIALRPVSRDAFGGADLLESKAEILVILGEHDAAIGVIEQLLAMPSNMSRNYVRLDPFYAPLRGNPRFQRLVSGSP